MEEQGVLALPISELIARHWKQGLDTINSGGER
jgi:hypothetical protein